MIPHFVDVRPVVLLEGLPGFFHLPTARLQSIGGCCGIDAAVVIIGATKTAAKPREAVDVRMDQAF